MAGVINNTARQYNLKCVKKGVRYVARIAPGFNIVPDDHWKPFINDPYVKGLKKDGHIDFGSKVNDMELDKDPNTVCKSKAEKMPDEGKGINEGLHDTESDEGNEDL